MGGPLRARLQHHIKRQTPRDLLAVAGSIRVAPEVRKGRRDLRGLSTMRAEARRGVLGRLEGHRRDPPQRSKAEVEAGLAGWDPTQVSGQARRPFHRSDAFDYAGWVNVHAPAGGACNGIERAAARYTSEGDRRYAPSVAHGVQSRDDLSVWRGAPGARRCP
jgi:hypothetical protein